MAVKIYGIREDNKCKREVIPKDWVYDYRLRKSDFTPGDAGTAYVLMSAAFINTTECYTVDCLFYDFSLKRFTPIPVKHNIEEVLQSNVPCCHYSVTVNFKMRCVDLYLSISSSIYNSLDINDEIRAVCRRYM